MRILFTSVGRRVELMQAFRRAASKAGITLTIYGVDMSKSAPALFFCDRQIEVCGIKDEMYIPTLLDICAAEKIAAVIPTIDTDLLLLAQNKSRFESIGTKVLVSDESIVEICRDKSLTFEFFTSCGLKAPKSVDDWRDYNSGFPAFIKPKDGSSSINAFKVENASSLEQLAKVVGDYVVQPYILGCEYTVDILCGFDKKPIYITPRKRLAVRSGEVLITEIAQDEQIIKECRILIDKFEPVGQITVQLIRDTKTGDDYYIEINPRFGGGAPLSIMAGADSAEAVIRMLDNQQLNYTKNAAKDGMVLSRFDQSICTNWGKSSALKAVVFDLDDTLYPEKEYVLSGFMAIEKEHGISANELYHAFENGNPAIDVVLKKGNKQALKDACLKTYREHSPNISLYPEAKGLLEFLRLKGIFVGVITDGRPIGQRKKAQALALDELVDEIIITDELGGAQFRKPCDIAYRIMQKRANVEYQQMIYIGDNPYKDFAACLQLGMQCLYFVNTDRIRKTSGINSVPSASTWSALSHYIKQRILH